MISITSYAKQKKSSSSSNNNGGGGFANAQVYNNGFNPFYLWGQYIDGRDTINGDLISNGTITGNKIVAPQGNIDLIYALSEYVNYISGHTAIFDNLSGDTAHFNQDVFVGGDIDIVGDTNITGDTTIYGDLAVSGDTHLKNVWTQNINNSDTIKTKNLEVTGLAHFFQLVIDRIKAAGGAILLTPADGFETALVEEDASGYTLYFHAKDGEKQISNMWEVNDQAICQTFNASTGTSYNVSNTYYWALVTEVSEQAVQKTVSGVTEEYHYIKLSKSVYDGELNPKVGDEIAMLGSRNDEDPQRQSAIYMAAYTSLDQGLTAPCFAEYKGINDFSLSTHRHSYIDATGASFTGDFRIDNNTTIQDYVNSATTEVRNEFRFNEEGLYSRVSKLTNPNILAANGWVDQDDKALLQEDDEEYLFEQEQQSLAKGGGQIESEEEEYIGIPPIIYLNADTYTFSTYSRVKYENIKYGVEKDNLDQTISAFTGCNSGDTWHDQARMICTFVAPIDGYYQFGMKLMDSGYTGDYQWTDPDPTPSGLTPTQPTDIITTEIQLTMDSTTIYTNQSGATVTAMVTCSDNQPYLGQIGYSSSNPSAATIDQQGNIAIVGLGTTTITATIPEAYVMGKHYSASTGTLQVTVEEPAENKFLTVTATQGGTVNIDLSNIGDHTVEIYYKKDGESAFTRATSAVTPVSLSTGQSVKFFGNNDTLGWNYPTTNSVRITGNYPGYYDVSGHVTSLLSSGCPSTLSETTIAKGSTFLQLFKNLRVKNASGLTLPDNVSPSCYSGMFSGCTFLQTAPQLPASTLARGCYGGMFQDCWSLTAAPVLSATTLGIACYSQMFQDCRSLTTPPALPAIYTEDECYYKMFYGCSGMTSAPALPATTAKESCYQAMFGYCSSLTTPPALPATILNDYCYWSMFFKCENLQTAPQLPASILREGCYGMMFQDCTSLTTPPVLSATTLATSCYAGMFYNCYNLTTPPALPATTLKSGCYNEMFKNCTSMTSAPELSATTLEWQCYLDMFEGCSNISVVDVSFTSIPQNNSYGYLGNWLKDTYPVGQVYAPANRNWDSNTSGANIPEGWRVRDKS